MSKCMLTWVKLPYHVKVVHSQGRWAIHPHHTIGRIKIKPDHLVSENAVGFFIIWAGLLVFMVNPKHHIDYFAPNDE